MKINKDAGRGSPIFVRLRLENGEVLPFILDTGASGTCFEKSLEPKLGECLGTFTSWRCGIKDDAGLYVAPKLFLGNTALEMTGSNVVSLDLRKLSADLGYPVAGILGMDVLEHYCLQLDFARSRLRFLDDPHAHKRSWGKVFSLSDLGDGCLSVGENLAGMEAPGSLIDTGYDGDGSLMPSLFQQWTNQATALTKGQARSPTGLLSGEVYPKVYLDRLSENVVSSGDSHMKLNIIGLRFLARHLVTLDFPNRTMYLKRTSAGPLIVATRHWRTAAKSAFRFLDGLKGKGQLPGWSKTDRYAGKKVTFHHRSLDSGTFDFLKKGDASVYHYQVARESERSPWKLQRAWRTDESGGTIEEYPVPGAA